MKKIILAAALMIAAPAMAQNSVAETTTVTKSVTINRGSDTRNYGLDPCVDNYLSVRFAPYGPQKDRLYTNDRVCIIVSAPISLAACYV
jgi:hypothetical protein